VYEALSYYAAGVGSAAKLLVYEALSYFSY
jgi:hypothetical protein